jgi:hypothetical protein
LLMTPADIRDGALFRLLGDISQPHIDASATGPMRLRLMQKDFSWQALVDLARGQGMLLPLTFALTARQLLPPIPRSIKYLKYSESHVTAWLGRIYRQHLARRGADGRQLQKIIRTLAGVGITPLIIKGARYLAEPAPAWCEARAMADLDILVRPSEAQRAFATMQANGYRVLRDDDDIYGPYLSHHLPALQHPEQLAPIEIHIDALSAAAQKVMSTQHVWAQAVRSCDGSCFILPMRWHALHGLLHHQIQDRGHVQQTLNMKGVWEWTMLAREFTREDWEAVAEHMRAAGASDVVESWVAQSQRLFGLELPYPLRVSRTARRHADATFRVAGRPYWLRRTRYIADQIRTSFARETLAGKYGIPLARVSLLHVGRNMIDLLRRHRRRVLQRITGYQDQLW